MTNVHVHVCIIYMYSLIAQTRYCTHTHTHKLKNPKLLRRLHVEKWRDGIEGYTCDSHMISWGCLSGFLAPCNQCHGTGDVAHWNLVILDKHVMKNWTIWLCVCACMLYIHVLVASIPGIS